MNQLKRFVKCLLTILSTAWYGALTIFSGIVFTVATFRFVDKYLNNNIVASVLLAIGLIILTWAIGHVIKEKMG